MIVLAMALDKNTYLTGFAGCFSYDMVLYKDLFIAAVT